MLSCDATHTLLGADQGEKGNLSTQPNWQPGGKAWSDSKSILRDIWTNYNYFLVLLKQLKKMLPLPHIRSPSYTHRFASQRC